MLRYLNKKRNNKGQSTLEYAVLIIIVIGALLSIQVYIKRGIQGRLRSAADDIGDQFSVGNTNYTRTVTTHSETKDMFKNGVTESKLTAAETTNETVNSEIMKIDEEFWGLEPKVEE